MSYEVRTQWLELERSSEGFPIVYIMGKKKKKKFEYFQMFQLSHYSFTVASQTWVYSTVVIHQDGIWEHCISHDLTEPKYWSIEYLLLHPITSCAAFTNVDEDTPKSFSVLRLHLRQTAFIAMRKDVDRAHHSISGLSIQKHICFHRWPSLRENPGSNLCPKRPWDIIIVTAFTRDC